MGMPTAMAPAAHTRCCCCCAACELIAKCSACIDGGETEHASHGGEPKYEGGEAQSWKGAKGIGGEHESAGGEWQCAAPKPPTAAP